MSNVEAAYRAGPGSKLSVDKAFYNSLKGTEAKRTLVDTIKIPMRSGKAWEVPAGHIFRIRVSEGPQVGDFNMWNKHDPRERMWASRSRQLQRAHVSTHDRLWSTLPFLRPMVTIIDDSLADYGQDAEGGESS
jgi:uncharacterized protein YcgI (DUF1989 family)